MTLALVAAMAPQSARSRRSRTSVPQTTVKTASTTAAKMGHIHGLSDSIYEILLKNMPPRMLKFWELSEYLDLKDDIFELSLIHDVIIIYKEPRAKLLITNYLLGNADIVKKHLAYAWYRDYEFDWLPEYLKISRELWDELWSNPTEALIISQPAVDKSSTMYKKALSRARALGIFVLFSGFKKPAEYVNSIYAPKSEGHRYLIQRLVEEDLKLNHKLSLIAKVMDGKIHPVLRSLDKERKNFKSLCKEYCADGDLPRFVLSYMEYSTGHMKYAQLYTLVSQKEKAKQQQASKAIVKEKMIVPQVEELFKKCRSTKSILNISLLMHKHPLLKITMRVYDFLGYPFEFRFGEFDSKRIAELFAHIHKLNLAERGFKDDFC